MYSWSSLRRNSQLSACVAFLITDMYYSDPLCFYSGLHWKDDKWNLINFYLFCSMWSLFLTPWSVSVLLKISKGHFSVKVPLRLSNVLDTVVHDLLLESFFHFLLYLASPCFLCVSERSFTFATHSPTFLKCSLLSPYYCSCSLYSYNFSDFSTRATDFPADFPGQSSSRVVHSQVLDEFFTTHSVCPNQVLSCFPDFTYWTKVSHLQFPPNKYKLNKAVKFIFSKQVSNHAVFFFSKF